MGQPLYPALYEIHTRPWLRELATDRERPLKLDEVPDVVLDGLAALGFDWIWLMGVWQTGAASRGVSRSQASWRTEFQALLPDLTDADICGSPFAVERYEVHADFGGNEALQRLRRSLQERGLRLMLDFVPNHAALDYAWVHDHPEYFVAGTDSDLVREPENYCRVETKHGARVLAHGRDPFFPGWPDTLQLNYRHAALRQAMIGELGKVATLCDGVRCDMAMLILPDIFMRTWGNKALPADGSFPVDASFWPQAIGDIRERFGRFLFLAEAYWDQEWTLQQQGFDYTYDKRHHDRLHARDVEGVRGHLWADPEYQRKSVRFVENHDEPRAASAFPHHVHRAAALLTFLVPGMRFFYEGQLEGRRVRLPVHLGRWPREPIDGSLRDFYLRLLDCLQRPEVRNGRWQLVEGNPAWEGNPTWTRFIAFSWELTPQPGCEPSETRQLLVVVNYGPSQGQCYLRLPASFLRAPRLLLRDLMGTVLYEREREALASHGLYLDLPDWGYHVFEVIGLCERSGV
jgi:hypothetical protein